MTAALPLEIALEVEAGDWPPEGELDAVLQRVAEACLAELDVAATQPPELGVTFTDDDRIAELNRQWRGKSGPTNVLSFPLVELTPGAEMPPMLGDIVIAFETVAREAQEQEKPFIDHLTHLLVHGLLHLVGYDHMNDDEAETMEALERRILERLAIPDPYA